MSASPADHLSILAPADAPVLVPSSGEQASPAPRTRRVLHFINGEHYSGAERVQDLLALCLPAQGVEVGFACLKPDRFPALRVSQQTSLTEMPMRTKWDFSVIGRLTRLVRAGEYELVHAHTPRTALLGRIVAQAADVPLVYHVHSPTARDSTRRWANRANQWVERWAIAGAAHLIAVSQSLGSYMRPIVPARIPITVVPNGVPAAVPPPRSAPQDVWTLGVVALFRPRKGLEVLLEALAELQRANAPVRLRAIGGFETAAYERDIKTLAERLGVAEQIDWVGFTRDVSGELAKLDVMVLPSLFGEGLPMVVLEAMAAGVPVVATRVEGVPEAIRHGQDGVLVEPQSPSALAQGIKQLLAGELSWTALRESALQRHANQFSDQAMAAGVAQVYHAVLAPQPA